jgi:TolB-like protein/DNA-binding winged helix-turn-helix (wHTH) protein/Tfp pilus assembly protein PilF
MAEAGMGEGMQTGFDVGEWRVDPASNSLRHGEETVRLEPKVMEVLVQLAVRQPEVVSRQELEASVWAGVVVTYDALTNTIIKLRRTFGDDPRHPRFIETISKKGYRLLAPVRWLGALPSASVVPSRESLEAAGGRPPRSRRIWLAIALLALPLLAAWLGYTRGRPSPEPIFVPAAARPVLAVLPFDNLSGDPAQQYFANGMTDDLITDLSGLDGLLVLARNSVFVYKGSTQSEQEIGRRLGARYLLKGSLQRDGEHLRINVQLVDAEDGGVRWAGRYSERVDAIFRIQDEITAHTVAVLEGVLRPEEPRHLARRAIPRIEAYDAFLRGLDHYARRSREDNQEAKRHFREAMTLDPKFARAYAALALAHSRDAIDGWVVPASRAMDEAEALARRALELDDRSPQVRFVMGQVELSRQRYARAIEEVEQAIALKPSYADGYALLAWVLHFAGRPEEGLESMQRAIRLNPRVPAIYRLVWGCLHYALEQHTEAVRLLEEGADISPHHQQLRVWLAAAYAGAGRLEEARWQAAEIGTLNPAFSLKDVEQEFPIRDPLYMERLTRDLKRAGVAP